MKRKLLVLLGGVFFAASLLVFADDGNEADTAVLPVGDMPMADAPVADVPAGDMPMADAPIAVEENKLEAPGAGEVKMEEEAPVGIPAAEEKKMEAAPEAEVREPKRLNLKPPYKLPK